MDIKKGNILMKRLLLFLCIFFDSWTMLHTTSSLRENNVKNISSRFNNAPCTFGTTHFIVGYQDPCVLRKKYKKNKLSTRTHQHNSDALFIDKERICQSFFSTAHDDLFTILLEVLSEVKKQLYVAAFALTDKRIVDFIVDAHKKGVEICVIVDAQNMNQRHSKVKILIKDNVPVWHYKPSLDPRYKKNGLSDPCMHHKVMIGDDFVITGSANFTKAGQKHNVENINILRDRQTIDEYRTEFERLKKFCVRCTSLITE